jgi:hypothetical protein
MLIKVILVFLGVMALVALLGNAFLSRFPRNRVSRHGRRDSNPLVCGKCGKVLSPQGVCDCKGKAG